MSYASRQLQRALAVAAGRLASGYPQDVCVVEDVRVQCRECGGVTVLPVLWDGGARPTPAPCAHCGKDI